MTARDDQAREARIYTPRPTPDSRKYWASIQAGTFRIARCDACRKWTHPPLERCKYCGGTLRFTPVVGHGIVYSFTTLHRGTGLVFPVPHTVVVVQLVEQDDLRVVGRLDTGCATPAVGMPVQSVISVLPGTRTKVVEFRPGID